jgi:ribosome-binding protein aMBF1 (putative translation factor)
MPSSDYDEYVEVHAGWKLHKVGPSVAHSTPTVDDFARRLQRSRVGARLTLQQLAQLCFVSAAHLASYEKNEDAPTESTKHFILKTCEDHRRTSSSTDE